MEDKFKLSYYIVESEPLNAANERVIFSTRTGLALTVSEKVYESVKAGDFAALPQSILDKLLDAQVLVNGAEEELSVIIAENKEAIPIEDSLYEVLQPSAMCQLGCPYCGQEHKKFYLAQKHYQPLLDRIEKKIKAGSYKYLYIGWFGGEPLMAIRQIRELTQLFRELAAKYDLGYGAKVVTNGLSLKPNIYQELVSKLSVNSIEITLDGTATFHDQKRYLKGGGDTFDLIFKNLVDVCTAPDFDASRCAISIRCNVDRTNVDGVEPLIELLAEYRLQDKIAYFYPIGIYSWGGNDAHNTALSKEEFAGLEIDWLLLLIKYGFTVNLLPGRVKKICMAVSPTSEMYDAYGNIFNCTEVSYTSFYDGTPYQLGNLSFSDTGTVPVRAFSEWNDEILAHKFQCGTCKMLPVCGGGCPKSWHEDMRACPTNKFNIKDKLALSYIATKMDLATV